ncbi:MAG: gamma-glutamyl-gamma-aminobutyrate hydrolase family protein [Rhodospirillales bacterium]|nr:gamma-glutamyl-gamma-aminobutyrate hydrolase family protein [Rhodospirillales bacterium]
MTERTAVPLIGVSACVRPDGRYVFHAVAEQYIRAARDGAGGLPVLLPALGGDADIDRLVARLDGLMLTGSPSNVEPVHYGGLPARPGTRLDPARDATTLPLIRRALADGLPLLALCRGHQELNVALGGTLHQHVHELSGKREHRAPADRPNEERYAPAHPVDLVPGGLLARLAGTQRVEVNSLHSQAIDRSAPGLIVEAMSADGVIEAVRVDGARSFALGVQWHPEWSLTTNGLSRAIFGAFGDAARARALCRLTTGADIA